MLYLYYILYYTYNIILIQCIIFINIKAKQIISLVLLNHFQWYRTDEFERKGNRRIIVYGSVTRYGPRTSCQRRGLNAAEKKSLDRWGWILTFDDDLSIGRAIFFDEALNHDPTTWKRRRVATIARLAAIYRSVS